MISDLANLILIVLIVGGLLRLVAPLVKLKDFSMEGATVVSASLATNRHSRVW